MRAPILTFFNNKGGVGKTSLVYHLAWMFAECRKKVLVLDLDPQANVTAAMLSEEELERIWEQDQDGTTVVKCVRPMMEFGDIVPPKLQRIAQGLFLLPGDVALSGFEEVLSRELPNARGFRELYRPLKILSAFWQLARLGAEQIDADLVLVDVGPNLGAINRSALAATDFVAIPLAADLFSLRGLQNLGPTLREWREQWKLIKDNWNASAEAKEKPEFTLPQGVMQPIGYLCQQPGIRMDRPVKAYDKWFLQMPRMYRKYVLDEDGDGPVPERDPECLAMLRHYRSLIPMGQEKRKPIFNLTPADGAAGSHAQAVAAARADFMSLARKIADRIGLSLDDMDLQGGC